MNSKIEIGQTHYNTLLKAHARLFELTGTMATLRLPVEAVSGIVEGLTAITQEVGDLKDSVEVVASGRGQHLKKTLVDDPRTSEQIADDLAAGIEVIQ